MFRRLRQLAFPCAVALVALIGRANAQSPRLTLGAHGKHASVGLTIGGGSESSGLAVRTSWLRSGDGWSRSNHRDYRARAWIPGHFETRCQRVWVAGCSRQVWMPARYEWRYDSCGSMYRVCISVGRWSTVTDPGRYELRESRVWVAGCWSTF